jgi:hypothetical protein
MSFASPTTSSQHEELKEENEDEVEEAERQAEHEEWQLQLQLQQLQMLAPAPVSQMPVLQESELETVDSQANKKIEDVAVEYALQEEHLTCLSGFLLRKFKRKEGWQKLWVVFANFSLFFYKSDQEESPLASLPLRGYRISFPSEEDAIDKNFVFKLYYKTHKFFFRAENEYSLLRWMDAIKTASQLRSHNRNK